MLLYPYIHTDMYSMYAALYHKFLQYVYILLHVTINTSFHRTQAQTSYMTRFAISTTLKNNM